MIIYLPLLISIISIQYLLTHKVCNLYLVFTIFSIIGLICTVTWIKNKNLNNLKNENHECIIGSVKKKEGIFYSGCFDIWHIYHVLLYIIIGLIFPNHYILILLISLIWEYIEHIFFKDFKFCNQIFCGRYEDFILNLLGYYIGSLFSLCK